MNFKPTLVVGVAVHIAADAHLFLVFGYRVAVVRVFHTQVPRARDSMFVVENVFQSGKVLVISILSTDRSIVAKPSLEMPGVLSTLPVAQVGPMDCANHPEIPLSFPNLVVRNATSSLILSSAG